MANSIPSDVHAIGDAGHTTDHNNIADVLHLGNDLNAKLTTYGGGAKGDGVTDDTAALTAWINAINGSAPGANAYLPPGQYMVSSSLPALTQPGVTVNGAGDAQTASTKGSVITASAVFSPLWTLTGEGTTLQNMTLDGGGKTSTVCVINGPQVSHVNMQIRGCASGGIACDIQTGGVTAWLVNSIYNGINGANTSIQVNDTDAIIVGCKPKNGAFNIVLLGGASGAIIESCHMTPGGGSGQNCVYINGNPGRIQIVGNRFDNYVRAAVQVSPGASNGNTLMISNNMFYSTVQTDATWPCIGVDTSSAGYRGLQIVGNHNFATVTNRPLNFLAAITQAGAAATNPTRISTLGSTVQGNVAYVTPTTGAFYGTSASPLSSGGNIVTTDGATFTSVP